MLGAGFVSIVAVCYVGLLFAIARYGERHADRFRTAAWEPLIYALSLAVFCSAWTFYGSVGHAASTGLGFTLTYLAPVLVLLPGYPILLKIIRTAKADNATSIADFIGARFGKSQLVATLVTVVAVLGVVPLIALQLQAVSTTFEVLVTGTPRARGSVTDIMPFWRDTAFYASLGMALFVILFGLRRVQSNERHPGMMAAIAFESLVKLAAFLAIGLFVTFGVFGGPSQLFERLASAPEIADRVAGLHPRPSWVPITLVAALAFICLPRQFHVVVVENAHTEHLRVAARVFPVYLLVLALFVPAIAAAGLMMLPSAPPELFPLLLPMNSALPPLSLAIFLAGLSAATAMMIVEVVALSTMICNEIVMPLLSRSAALGHRVGTNMTVLLLRTRWIAAFGLLLAAYAYHAVTANRYSLSSIGLISFVAVAQFAPALLFGLYWRGAHRHGAVAGITAGSLLWAYHMFLPSLPGIGPAFRGGAPAIGRLPEIFPSLDPFSNMVAWSLGANVVLFIAFSLLARYRERDRAPVPATATSERTKAIRFAAAPRGSIHEELWRLAERVVGAEQAARAFRICDESWSERDVAALTERLLSGAVGAASAHIMVTAVLHRHSIHSSGRRSILTDASEAILFNHDLLRATLENVTQGIGMFDAQGNLAAWNRRFVEMLNIPDARARIGAPLSQVLGDRERLGFDPACVLGPGPGLPTTAHTAQQRLPDGRVFELQVNPIQAGGFVLVCTDITAQIQTLEALRNSERQIREANELLEQRVAERTRELTLLNQQLAEAKRAAEAANVGKTRFFAAASHDLLQPLHVARILTGALSERYGASKASTLTQLDRALGAVDELLQTLLDISKLDTGAVQPQLQPADLQKLVTGVATAFQPIAVQRGVILRVGASRGIVMTDPALLRRILQNLLSNALRYTRRNGKVLIGCRRRAGRILIEVWDTGIGIPENQRTAIFEEFKRGVDNDPETPPGLGLGLAIVDRIARMLEHPISVRSWPGRGSVFSVSVPVSTEMPLAQLQGADDRPRGSLANRLVLCVDNDDAVLNAMRTLLQGWSCDVLTATGIEDARSEIQEHGVPDIVLMDYHLGGELTGFAALDALSSHAGRALPAILITANYTEQVRKEAEALGYPILHKPVRPGALRALMAQMLSRETRPPRTLAAS